jgi:hypothetical protein
MTLMSSKFFCQKNYFEAIFFRISDCAKNVMGYTVSKCHNRISEFEKSRLRLDSVMHFLTLYLNILV